MPSNQWKILVAEDNEVSRRLCLEILTKMGCHKVTAVSDGAMAMKEIKDALAAGEPYSLVISDWQMPNINGITLLKKLRQQEDTSRLPFMLLTGINDKELVLEAIQAGASTFLSKPFSPGLFEKKIGEILDTPVLNTSFRRTGGR